MGTGSHIADTIRTLLVAGTVGFLGYLAYTLIQARIDNPPTQGVAMDDEEVADLKNTLHRLGAEVRAIDKRLDALGSELATIPTDSGRLPAGTAIEYGTVVFRKGRKLAWKEIRFENKYASPPLVIVSESGTAGDWATVKSEKITTTGARIAARVRKDYLCHVGYIVIGQAK